MLKSPRPSGASRSPDDPTVAMQRIIDQAVAGAWPTRPQLIPESYSHVAARAAMSSC